MIYGFRGARGDFILNFKKIYSDAHVIKLEQNYRSTKKILEAANNLIAHNYNRNKKHLWTNKGKGVDIGFEVYSD